MADPVVFNNAYVSISTTTAAAFTEISGVKSVEMPVSRAELSDSAMGDDIEAFFPGILSVPITIKARQDFTTSAAVNAAGVDKLLWGLFNNKKPIRFKMRAVDSAVSATNPSYRIGKAYVTSVTPMSGAHGVALENQFTIRAASIQASANFSRSTTT